jgi:hypothetical protein
LDASRFKIVFVIWRRWARARLTLDSEPAGTVASADHQVVQAELMRRRSAPAPESRSSFAGFRFPPEVITVAVRWYLRYGLSYRDVEELLAERNIEVDHVTVYRWVQRFTPLLIDAARPCRRAAGDPGLWTRPL